jgi:hypothetical protein
VSGLAILLCVLISSILWATHLLEPNLSPEFQKLEKYFDSHGIEVRGGQVRRESSLVRSRAIFSTTQGETKESFFVERCYDENGAEKRAVELSEMVYVTSSRVVRNGPWVLYISNDWNPNDTKAQELKEVFLAFPVQE